MSTAPASAASFSAAPGSARSATLARQLGDEGVERLLLAAAEDQLRAAAGERRGHRPPEAAGGAGQEG